MRGLLQDLDLVVAVSNNLSAEIDFPKGTLALQCFELNLECDHFRHDSVSASSKVEPESMFSYVRYCKVNKLQMAKLGFVIASTASFFLSVYLWFSGSKDEGLFVGIWVPSILSFGCLLLSGKSNG